MFEKMPHGDDVERCRRIIDALDGTDGHRYLQFILNVGGGIGGNVHPLDLVTLITTGHKKIAHTATDVEEPASLPRPS
ncbi:MAG: hypothetical protein MZV70_48830 [Desulfobacterales bacterium]|nr:hypothetical protein [Desulfobacterales bacterium]